MASVGKEAVMAFVKATPSIRSREFLSMIESFLELKKMLETQKVIKYW